jgi:hypothetical protein
MTLMVFADARAQARGWRAPVLGCDPGGRRIATPIRIRNIQAPQPAATDAQAR